MRAATENQVAVSIKHFPGDGVDERDQHILTSVNSTIIITSPQADLTEEEFSILSEWLQSGGRLIMSIDNTIEMDRIANFKALLEIYQLSFGDGYVVEDSNATSNWITTPFMVIPQMNTENEIMQAMAEKNGYLRVYAGRPINNCDMPLSGVKYEALLTTSDGAYVKSPDSPTDLLDRSDAIAEGSQILAYTAFRSPDYEDLSKDVRIALLSTPLLYADTNILTQSYNMDFTMSVMEWLVNRDVSVYVRASQILNTTLSVPDVGTVISIAVVSMLIPLAVAAAGVVVWVRRRRL